MMLDSMRTPRPRAACRRSSTRASSLVERVEPRLLFATFTVTTTADVGAGSLRQAIIEANNNQNTVEDGPDWILFEINPTQFLPTNGVFTITPATPLPAITDPVFLDGTAEDLWTPTIEINGSNAGANADGLVIASSDPVFASFVTGLIINRFSGNGIRITGDGNGVGMSFIGTNGTGTAAGGGNGGHGILIESDGNFAVDTVIAYNGGDGVAVTSSSTGNDLSVNNIFANGGMGIDLGDNGRTPNDAGDADTGANDLQNFPVITAVTPAVAPATGVVVTGTINSTPNTELDIAIYSSATPEGQGQTFLHHESVVTDANGNATFNLAVTDPTVTPSRYFTATATRVFYLPSGESFNLSTSEFSDAFGPPTASVAQVYVKGSAWNARFLNELAEDGVGTAELGYRVDQLDPAVANSTLPWINANQVVVVYDRDLGAGGVPQAGAFTLDGVRHDYAVTAVAPLGARAVVLTLDRPLGNNPGGAGADGDRVTLTVNGGGAAGANYSRVLNVLQGDANRAGGTVNSFGDLAFVRARLNRSAEAEGTGATYTVWADLNASGDINSFVDLAAVRARLNDALPPAAPAAAAGTFSDERIAELVLV